MTLNNETYETIDWGMGGFRIKNYEGKLRSGDETTLTHIAPPHMKGKPAKTPVRVVSFSPTAKELACAFVELDDRGYDILESIFLHRYKDPK